MIPGYHGLIFISCFILKRKAGSSNFYRCALFARKKKKKECYLVQLCDCQRAKEEM